MTSPYFNVPGICCNLPEVRYNETDSSNKCSHQGSTQEAHYGDQPCTASVQLSAKVNSGGNSKFRMS